MTRKSEEIKVEEINSLHVDQKLTHPAFGQIAASRISGHVNLYGSEFHHHGFIAIRINHSELNRSLSRDWPFPRKEIVEVYLSEAQWASFVSSLNIGSGVQCTISHLNGEGVPEIPSLPDRREQFSSEVNAKMEDAKKSITEIIQKIDGLKISEKAKTELKRELSMVSGRITNSVDFVAKSFSEHMEEQTEKAKCEVNAYIAGTLQRSGLEALQNGTPISLLEKKGD